jgi:hypothetical protein
MATIAARETESVAFVVVGYAAGKRGALRVAEQTQCSSEGSARMRAERLMESGRVLGVDVVRQVCDPELGEYPEPEYLCRLGRVPEVD